MKTRIRNTNTHEAISIHGLRLMVGIEPDTLGEEKQGAHQMVHADQLPVTGFVVSRGSASAFDKIFTAAGGKVGDRSEGDPLFVDVALPPGWTKKETGHSMWTDLLDANGNRRAGIFYKAAFYDRAAHLDPNLRFYTCVVVPDSSKPYQSQPAIPTIKDSNDRVVWEGAPIPTDPKKSWESADQARVVAKAMLAKCYPDYEKLDAYWDVKEFKFE